MKTPAYPRFDGSQLCAEIGVDSFFCDDEAPGAARFNADAKSICARCEWLEPCLDYALRVTVVGVWGGTTTEERRRIRRQRNIVAVALADTMPRLPSGDPSRTRSVSLSA